MKKLMIAALVAGFAFSPAIASDVAGHCVAYNTENDGDASGCSCLAEAADGDMTAELLAVESQADIENLSAASQGAIEACWPEA